MLEKLEKKKGVTMFEKSMQILKEKADDND